MCTLEHLRILSSIIKTHTTHTMYIHSPGLTCDDLAESYTYILGKHTKHTKHTNKIVIEDRV